MSAKILAAVVLVLVAVSAVHAATLQSMDSGNVKGSGAACFGDHDSKRDCEQKCKECVSQKSKSKNSPYFWCADSNGASYCVKSTDKYFTSSSSPCSYGPGMLAPKSVADRKNWLANTDECQAWMSGVMTPDLGAMTSTEDSFFISMETDSNRPTLERLGRMFKCNDFPRTLALAGAGERELDKQMKKLNSVKKMLTVLCGKWEKNNEANGDSEGCPLVSHPFCDEVKKSKAAGGSLDDLVSSVDAIDGYMKSMESLVDGHDEEELATIKKVPVSPDDAEEVDGDKPAESPASNEESGKDGLTPAAGEESRDESRDESPSDRSQEKPRAAVVSTPALVKATEVKRENLELEDPISDEAISALNLDLLEISERLSDEAEGGKSVQETSAYECGLMQGRAAALARAVNVGLEALKEDMKTGSPLDNIRTLYNDALRKVVASRAEVRGILKALLLTGYKFEQALPPAEVLDKCEDVSDAYDSGLLKKDKK